MIDYYWRITMVYRLRQSIDPFEEPHVMQLMRALASELALHQPIDYVSFSRKYPERYKTLLSQCCDPDGSLVKAILRLHMVTYYRVDPKLYEVQGNELHLSAGAVEFLLRYRWTVEQMAIAYWVSFTEQITSSPRLDAKIGGLNDGLDENEKRKYRRILGEFWNDVCFYCGRTALEAAIEIGFLVPFAYVLQIRVWNLVFNCEVCRPSKGEQTPPNFYVEKLVERNRELLALIQRSNVGLGNRDIHELNHFGPRIAEHLRGLVEGCRADGFGTWPGPDRIQSN